MTRTSLFSRLRAHNFKSTGPSAVAGGLAAAGEMPAARHLLATAAAGAGGPAMARSRRGHRGCQLLVIRWPRVAGAIREVGPSAGRPGPWTRPWSPPRCPGAWTRHWTRPGAWTRPMAPWARPQAPPRPRRSLGRRRGAKVARSAVRPLLTHGQLSPVAYRRWLAPCRVPRRAACRRGGRIQWW